MLKNLAPLGAKPGSASFAGGGQKQLRSYRASEQKGPLSYKHPAPLGRSDKTVLLHFQIEFSIYHFSFDANSTTTVFRSCVQIVSNL
jgi:hypothetical protein